MAAVLPNEPCPCGSGFKFKKCCAPFLKGVPIDNPERLLRSRYAAHIARDARFLWDTLHPESPRKLNDTWTKFQREYDLLRGVVYRGLRLLDEDYSKKDKAILVYWVQAYEGEHDLSFLEEGVFRPFEGRWMYFDGLKRSANRIGCQPESVKIGDLETLFLHDSKFN